MNVRLLNWFKFRWLWLSPIIVSAIITTVWIYDSFFYEPNQLTPTISVDHPQIADLKLSIIYPVAISPETRGAERKAITIYSDSNSHQDAIPLFAFLRAPIGIVHFLDKEGNVVSGNLEIPVGNNSRPITIWLEHANTAIAASTKEFKVEIFLGDHGMNQPSNPKRIEELDLVIDLEPRWREFFRTGIQSTFGTVAPLTFVGLLIGFSIRRYTTHKRLEPKYRDLQYFMSSKSWSDAHSKCAEIMEIDPLYDDLLSMYKLVNENKHEQDRRLEGLYIRASGFINARQWNKAKEALDEIRNEHSEYKDTLQLSIRVEAMVNEVAQLKDLYDQATHTKLSGDLQAAINYFRQVIAIDPDFRDSQSQLEQLEQQLLKEMGSNRSVLLATFAAPAVGKKFLAAKIGAAPEIMGKWLLEASQAEDVGVRRNLAEIATYVRSPLSQEVLSTLRHDEDEIVRKLASQGLTRDELITQLGNNDTWVEAAERLVEMGEQVLGDLIPLLAEKWPLWERAALVLRALGEDAVTYAISRCDEVMIERLGRIIRREIGPPVDDPDKKNK